MSLVRSRRNFRGDSQGLWQRELPLVTSRRTSSENAPLGTAALLSSTGLDGRFHTRSLRAAAVFHLSRVTPLLSSRILSDVGSRAHPRGLALPALPRISSFNSTANVFETAHDLLDRTPGRMHTSCDGSVVSSPPARCPHTGCPDFTVARLASVPRHDLPSDRPRLQPGRVEGLPPAH
jgi:hypothetical protein